MLRMKGGRDTRPGSALLSPHAGCDRCTVYLLLRLRARPAAFDAVVAISFRRLALSALARASPPFLPRATAAGFLAAVVMG